MHLHISIVDLIADVITKWRHNIYVSCSYTLISFLLSLDKWDFNGTSKLNGSKSTKPWLPLFSSRTVWRYQRGNSKKDRLYNGTNRKKDKNINYGRHYTKQNKNPKKLKTEQHESY
jgi:hypothetical protein